MSTDGHRRSGRFLTGAAVLVAVAGAGLAGLGIVGTPPDRPTGSAAIPPAPASAGPAVPPSRSPATTTPRPSSVPVALPRSVPIHLRIPAIGVDAPLMQLGLKGDGTLQVPPYSKSAPPGWYRGSPTPGQTGPAVILGHVDTFEAGPVVFYRLARLKPGDLISIDRRDGRTATFRVQRVENVPKNRFPTLEVYGDTPRPELRLLTCGGDWNSERHDYADNTVVFAALVPQSR
jgi:LPXTG-site transpeptidase (sortase) family protein